MSIITLTTDWNKNDYYVGAIKGNILKRCHDISIIDISHDIQPFNIAQGAFVLRNSYHFFPANTIHIIGINNVDNADHDYLLVHAEQHYFIGVDNGVFSLIFNNIKPENILKLPNPKENKGVTFPSLSIFSEAACKIVEGESLASVGEQTDCFKERVPIRPIADESGITGNIIYIDSYKNVITNITEKFFTESLNKKSFEILVQSNHYRIKKISRHYSESPVGELVAVFNSLGLLEIAINCGNAADLLNLDINSKVRIRFIDK